MQVNNNLLISPEYLKLKSQNNINIARQNYQNSITNDNLKLENYNTFSNIPSVSRLVSNLISQLSYNSNIPSILRNQNTLYLTPEALRMSKNNLSNNSYIFNSGIMSLTPAQLKQLGTTNKIGFFQVLIPTALEAERIYGVPAEVTLAQAALESGWGTSPIAGYNIFGIKGKGPAGSVRVKTREYGPNGYYTIYDNFAKYNNFYEAIMEHGRIFHNGYYKKGIKEYAINKDPIRFIDNIGKIYATSPTYAREIKYIIQKYNLIGLVNLYRR